MRKTLVQQIYEYSLSVPNKMAVIADDGEISYGELWNKIRGYAALLKSKGVGPGDVVVLKGMHTINFVVAEFSVHLAGAATALIEKDMQILGIQKISELLNAKAVIADVVSDNEVYCDINSVTDECVDVLGNELVFPDLQQCAEIIYTTGTTGQSKGVQLSHASVVSVIENIVHAENIESDNVALVPMPLNHVFGLRRYQTALYCGTTVVLQECLKPIKKFFRALKQYRVTSLSLVPSAISYIFAISKDLLGTYSGQIRYIESSAAPISMECKNKLRELLPEARLFSFYGCTESTAACVIEYSKYLDRDRCAGIPTVNTQVYIIDDDTLAFTQDSNCIGRVIFKSDANMIGYWKNPETTNEIMKDGFLYTNDEGYFDDEGFLYLLGRKDDVINVGGNKVAPDEIEDVVIKIGEIEDCACIGIPNEVTGTELLLCIKTQSQEEEIVYRLKKYLSERLENYKIPSHIYVVDEIPRTYNGKLQRKKLREKFSGK